MRYHFNYETKDEFFELLDILKNKNLISSSVTLDITCLSNLTKLIHVLLKIPTTNEEAISIITDYCSNAIVSVKGDYFLIDVNLKDISNVKELNWLSYIEFDDENFNIFIIKNKISDVRYSEEELIKIVNSSTKDIFVLEDYIYFVNS